MLQKIFFFHKLSWNYNAVLAQMCMFYIAKIEIVHCKTYTKRFCFQRPDFWPWHQGQVQYKVFYCTSCLQGILYFFISYLPTKLKAFFRIFFSTILIIIFAKHRIPKIWNMIQIRNLSPFLVRILTRILILKYRAENKFLI